MGDKIEIIEDGLLIEQDAEDALAGLIEPMFGEGESDIVIAIAAIESIGKVPVSAGGKGLVF